MQTQLTKEEALREQIVQAAQQLFQHYGLRKVTMDDIARAVGRGKSGLYYYYKSKDEIFDVVIGREIADALRQLAVVVEQLPAASAKLEAFALGKLRLVREKSALYSVVYQDIHQYYSLDFTNRMRQRYQASEVAAVEQIITDGVRTKEFAGLKGMKANQVATVIVSSLYGFEQELFSDANLDEVEWNVKLLLHLLVKGLKE
jgi:AcrR family transcriptional regulator